MNEVESVSLSELSLDRDRPYDGQSHTFHGDRGAYLVHGVTIRDIFDAFMLGCFESSGLLQEEWPKSIFDLPWDDMDIMAVGQNMCCNIEKLMGIYPNVPKT